MITCPNCKSEIMEDVPVCVNCGVILSEISDVNQETQQAVNDAAYAEEKTQAAAPQESAAPAFYAEQPVYQGNAEQMNYAPSYNQQQAYNPSYNPNYNQPTQPVFQGYAAPQAMPYESATIPILSIVFAFLYPIAGLVLGIIGLIRSKQKPNKTKSLIGLIISIIPLILSIIGIGAIAAAIIEFLDYGFYF